MIKTGLHVFRFWQYKYSHFPEHSVRVILSGASCLFFYYLSYLTEEIPPGWLHSPLCLGMSLTRIQRALPASQCVPLEILATKANRVWDPDGWSCGTELVPSLAGPGRDPSCVWLKATVLTHRYTNHGREYGQGIGFGSAPGHVPREDAIAVASKLSSTENSFIFFLPLCLCLWEIY